MRKSARIAMSILVTICMLSVMLPITAYAVTPSVWIVNSGDRVYAGSTMPTDASASIALNAARNEYETAQICVRPDANVTGVSVTPSSLSDGAGHTIGTGNISVSAEYTHRDVRYFSETELETPPAGSTVYPDAGANQYPNALLPANTVTNLALEFMDSFSSASYYTWTTSGGTWAYESGAYSGTIASATNAYAWSPRYWGDYAYTAKFNIQSGSEAGITFRMQDASNMYLLALRSSGTAMQLYKVTGGTMTSLGTASPSIVNGTQYTVKVAASGKSIKCYLGSTLYISVGDGTYPTGGIGMRINNSHVHYDDVNLDSTPSYTDDFNGNSEAMWSPSGGGTWTVTSGQYYVEAPGGQSFSLAPGNFWGAGCTIQTDFKFDSSGIYSVGGLAFRYQDNLHYYYLCIGASRMGVNTLTLARVTPDGSNNPQYTTLGTANPTINDDTYYSVKIVADGINIKVYLLVGGAWTLEFSAAESVNNEFYSQDNPPIWGKIGLTSCISSRMYFDNFSITNTLTSSFDPTQINANMTQAYWYSVYVPAGQTPGTYTGTVAVNTSAGNTTVNVSVKVYNTSIQDPTAASAFDYYEFTYETANDFMFGIKAGDYNDANMHSLAANYAAFFKKHRMNCLSVALPDTIFALSTANPDGTYVFDWTYFDRYIQDFIDQGALKYFVIGFIDSAKNIMMFENVSGQKQVTTRPYSDDVAKDYIDAVLTSLYSHLNTKGWLNKIIMAGVDEPGSQADFDINNGVFDQYHAIFGSSAKTYCDQWYDNGNNYLSTQGHNTTYCMSPEMFDAHQRYYVSQSQQAGGMDVWTYNTAAHTQTYLSNNIAGPLVKARLIPWFLNKNLGEGYMHYIFNWWGIYSCATNAQQAIDHPQTGENNAFVYPDIADRSMYDSLEFEQMREGIEDYELLNLLKQTKPVLANRIIDSILTNSTVYTRSGAKVAQAHKNILDALVSSQPDGYDFIADWQFDNNGNDSSGCGNTLTLYNSPTYSSTDCVEGGYSLSLNGSNQYAGMASPVTKVTDNFAISAWVKWAGTTGSNQVIVYNGSTGASGYGLMLDASDSNRLKILLGGVAFISPASPVTLTSGVWTHLAVVRRNGSWELYKDGASVTLSSTTTPLTPADTFKIGGEGGASGFKGKIDTVRFCTGPLAQYEIQKLAGLYGGPKGIWTFNSDANDKSGNGLNLTLYGSPTYDTGTKREGTAALSLNGTSQYARVSGVATSLVNNVTISAWIYWGGTTGSNEVIAYNGTTASNGFGLILNSSSSNRLAIKCGGTTMTATTYAPPTNTWTLVTAVRKAGTWTLYANGSAQTLSSSTTTPSTPSGYVTVGGANTGANYFKGRIDEVRIFERALSQTEVNALFTVPETYKAAWLFNGDLNDVSGNGYAMTAYNTPLYHATLAKDGAQCLWLRDYTNAYATTASPVTTKTDDLTISEWVLWRGGGGAQFLFYNGIPGYNGYGVFAGPTGALTLYCGGVAYMDSTTTLPVNVWTNVTIRRTGGIWMLFVNGASCTLSSNNATPNTPDYYGTAACIEYNGFVDNMRIYESALTDDQIAKLAQQ